MLAWSRVMNSVGVMEVFLVPVGSDRHELYCEVAAPVATGDMPSTSLWGRLTESFRRAVAEGEEARLGRRSEQPAGGFRRTITRKLAEAVAEQRLLWHLRRQSAARLAHPDYMSSDDALAQSRAFIAADRDKHLRRCVINAVLLVLSAPIALVPGPNFFAYYFAFRTVGHYLSKRGAEQGLNGVSWTVIPSPQLTELRAALELEPHSRIARVDAIADALGLERLPGFIAGVADRPA